jgi:tripartite-type tricarboxylate transporter receptor subunit TctC
VTKLNAALREALKNAELTRTFVNQGNDPAPGTAEQLHALIGRDLQKWSKLARDAKINVD